MDEVAAYLAFSGAMGILQIRDNYSLYVQPEQKPLVFDHSFAALEFAWFFVSVAILITSDLSIVATMVPVLYIGFNIVGWVYGAVIYGRSDREDASSIDLSPTYISACLIYAIAFSLYCWIAVYLHYGS